MRVLQKISLSLTIFALVSSTGSCLNVEPLPLKPISETLEKLKKDVQTVSTFCQNKIDETRAIGNNPDLWKEYSKFNPKCLRHPYYCTEYRNLKFTKTVYKETLKQFEEYHTIYIRRLFNEITQYEAHPFEPIDKFETQISIDLRPIGQNCNNYAIGIQDNLRIRQELINKINAW